jgi:glycosyltransferase involved in cell wall biosynthesis
MRPVNGQPRVLIVGGPDVDARIELMRALGDEFCMTAAGSAPGLAERFAEAGLEYFYYFLDRGRNPCLDMYTIASLLRLFQRLRPHIVHTFDTKPCVWGPLAARLARVPGIVATLTGVGGALYLNDSVCTRAVRASYIALQRLACGVTNLTIFQNQEDAQHFISAKIVRDDTARLIPGSGVSTKRFAPGCVADDVRRRARSELGIQPSAELVITMVSRVIRSKGVLEFAAAAREIRRRDLRVRFLLVGPQDEGSIDRLSAAEMAGVKDAVTIVGPRQDIPVVLALSDIFALPSAYREGIPRVLLEAASMGLPIVTTDSPGCNAVVAHGVNGFLVPTRDAASLTRALLALIEDPVLRRRFGSASRRRAIERFDLSLIVKQTQSVYREVLARR